MNPQTKNWPMESREGVSLRDVFLPTPTTLSAPLWDAARNHILQLQRCDQCQHYQWTPQVVCRYCQSQGLVWTEVTGRGHIYSYSIVARPVAAGYETPYVVAIVELDEGPRLLANVVDSSLSEIAIGRPVEVTFEDFADVSLFHFKLSDLTGVDSA